jgi:hypothetical protein
MLKSRGSGDNLAEIKLRPGAMGKIFMEFIRSVPEYNALTLQGLC